MTYHRSSLRSRWFAVVVGILVSSCSDSSLPRGAARFDPDLVPASARSQALIEEGLTDPLTSDQRVLILVNLRVEGDVDRVRAIAAAQDALLARHISGFVLTRRYRHVPALAGEATRQAIEQLGRDPGVFFVQRDHRGDGQLKEAVPAIGGDQVRSMLGLTGRGVRVAVLDTGVDTDHPDLKDAVVAQHCFTQFACPPFAREGTSAEDDHGHGSNVAGIIASNGVVSSRGFAPDAELVVVKINNANDSGQESDWVAGMDWVYDNLSTSKVKLVNLSIGTTALYAGGQQECDAAHPAMTAAIKNLIDAGVAVFAATGNRGSSTMMPAPACNSGTIAVGATYDSSAGRQPPASIGTTYNARWGASFAACSDAASAFDQIACFTNSTARMDLLAPGAPIVSDSLRGQTEMYWGTSQAAPVAVGVAALMLQCNPGLTPAQIKQALVSTGVPRMDMRNGLTFPSLRALAAVKAVCDESDIDAPDAGPPQVADGGTADAAAVAASDAGEPPDANVGSDASVSSGDASAPPVTEIPGVDGSAPAVSDAGGTSLGAGAKADCDCGVAGARTRRGEVPALLAALSLALALSARRRFRR